MHPRLRAPGHVARLVMPHFAKVLTLHAVVGAEQVLGEHVRVDVRARWPERDVRFARDARVRPLASRPRGRS